jgi:NO-binding membrane sensor protein with MHYT domain
VDGPRIRWLLGAAVSIGGVGVWLMHFIAMLGLDIPGTLVRYDVARTTLSAAMSISAVFVGLLVFGVRSSFTVGRLLLGGMVMGLGINLTHYTSTQAVHIQGTITYDAYTVWLSIMIALVSGITALLFTALFDHPGLRVVASLIVGVAVTGMHYTGMAAIQVRLDPAAAAPTGVKALTFLLPVLGLGVLALTIPTYAILMTTTWSDSDDPRHEDLPNPPTPHRPEPPTGYPTNKVRQVRGVAQYARLPTVPAQRR